MHVTASRILATVRALQDIQYLCKQILATTSLNLAAGEFEPAEWHPEVQVYSKQKYVCPS